MQQAIRSVSCFATETNLRLVQFKIIISNNLCGIHATSIAVVGKSVEGTHLCILLGEIRVE